MELFQSSLYKLILYTIFQYHFKQKNIQQCKIDIYKITKITPKITFQQPDIQPHDPK